MTLSKLSAYLLLWVSATAFVLPGCDSKDKDESEESDDSSAKKKKDKKKKKKKKQKKGDDEDGDDKEASAKTSEPIEVPSISGFVVPAGGIFKHNQLNVGKRVLEFDNYTYKPLADYPRDKLKADFTKHLTAKGWQIKVDGTSYEVTKDGVTVTVMFGENGADETKLNIMGKS